MARHEYASFEELSPTQQKVVTVLRDKGYLKPDGTCVSRTGETFPVGWGTMKALSKHDWIMYDPGINAYVIYQEYNE